MSAPTVRDAASADAAACAAIYAPYVTSSATSFESDPPSPEEMANRIEETRSTHAWLVAEQEGRVTGYACARAYKPRAAYRWTCEVSVYVDAGRQRHGVGRLLYEDLLGRLAERGFRTAVATTTLPNAGSAGLHEALGFTLAGVLTDVGWKSGRWHAVALYQRAIGDEPYDAPPHEPA